MKVIFLGRDKPLYLFFEIKSTERAIEIRRKHDQNRNPTTFIHDDFPHNGKQYIYTQEVKGDRDFVYMYIRTCRRGLIQLWKVLEAGEGGHVLCARSSRSWPLLCFAGILEIRKWLRFG